MKLILQFIYCGKTMLNKLELKQFSESIRLVGIPLDIFTPVDERKLMVNKTFWKYNHKCK